MKQTLAALEQGEVQTPLELWDETFRIQAIKEAREILPHATGNDIQKRSRDTEEQS